MSRWRRLWTRDRLSIVASLFSLSRNVPFSGIRRGLRTALDFLGRALTAGAPVLFQTEYERETLERRMREAPWYAAHGDQTLRLDYDFTLYPSSSDPPVVFDVGGYRGDWAVEISAKFGCRIEIFEPIAEFARVIEERFAHNDRVRVHRYGLAGTDHEALITCDEGGSSTAISPLAGADPQTTPVALRDVVTVTDELASQVDLMKVNIEGGEYDLLERILDADMASRFRYLQIQFHLGVPDAEARAVAIRQRLSRTHTLMWQYPWVWESWRLKTG